MGKETDSTKTHGTVFQNSYSNHQQKNLRTKENTHSWVLSGRCGCRRRFMYFYCIQSPFSYRFYSCIIYILYLYFHYCLWTLCALYMVFYDKFIHLFDVETTFINLIWLNTLFENKDKSLYLKSVKVTYIWQLFDVSYQMNLSLSLG